MIGMMNAGNSSDVPVEFYSSPHRSSLFEARRRRETLSYTEDGRILLDGNLKFQQTPNELWQDLLMRMVCKSVYKRNLDRARSKSKVRRLLEQFSIQSNDPELPTITVAAEEDAKRPSSLQTSNTSQQSSPTTSYSSSSSAPYVTTIVIRQSD